MSYQLLSMLAPIRNNGARPGVKLKKIKGVTIHMTDNWGKGADAIAHANYLKNTKDTSSWHYCIDDKYATQSIPDDEVAHHSGTNTGNNTTISIEICVNPESDLTQACENAVLLAASLLKKYKLNISHLYRHYDWSGKWCPSHIMDCNPFSWDTFKEKVKNAMKKDIIVENIKYNDKTDTSHNKIGVGATVEFDGNSYCYSASNGGVAGVIPPAGSYTVTHYNPGALYSVHIDSYGWVPSGNCKLIDELEDYPSKNISKIVKVGATINFDGKGHCYATSDGKGRGMIPPAGKHTVTHYNKDAKYPIHIGSYGWVCASNCNVIKNKTIKVGDSVKFDGKDHCYATSDGKGRGMIPPKGTYTVTYYNPGSKCPIHIDPYGWVSELNCTII